MTNRRVRYDSSVHLLFPFSGHLSFFEGRSRCPLLYRLGPPETREYRYFDFC